MSLRLPVLFAACLGAMSLLGCGGASSLLGSTITTPTINSISNPGVRGQTITITGTGLNGVNTAATFANQAGLPLASVNASSGTTTSVVVSVPTTIPAGIYSVSVTTSDGTNDGLVSPASNAVTITVN